MVAHVATPAEPLKPAVPVKRSITAEFIICLEDSKKFKSLKRHLRTQYDMTPDQYRAKWNLPPDYPMVAPNYAAARSQLGQANGARAATPPPPRSRLTHSSAALQDADQAVRKAEPLGQNLDHVTKQGLAEHRLFALDALEGVGVEHIKYARGLGLDRCAARALGYQAHLTDRRVPAEAANPRGSAFRQIDDDADAALEDEMHRRRRIALAGDDVVGLNFEAPAIFGQTIGEMGIAERLRQPGAQRSRSR